MEFNIQKYLVENKLTKLSYLREDDNTGAMLNPGEDEEYFDSNSADPFGGEYTMKGVENPRKSDYFQNQNEPSFDKEPERNVRLDKSTKDLEAKQKELSTLEAKKDELLLQLKSGAINLDQYKQSIGNIPTQIKKLRADVSNNLSPSLDADTETEEEF